MIEENNIVSKRGPKKASAKNANAKKTSKPVVRKAKPKRIPMHQSAAQSEPKEVREAKENGFYVRLCADYGKGKLQRYENAGYEYIMTTDEDGHQRKLSLPGGHTRYYMKLPMDIYLQDQLDKKQKVIDTTAEARKQANRIDTNSVVPDYIPKGQNSVLEKDGFS